MNKYDNMADTVIKWVKSHEDWYPADWVEAIAKGNTQKSYDLITKNPNMTLEEFRKLTQQ